VETQEALAVGDMANFKDMVGTGHDTVAKIFWAVARERDATIAMTHKEHGIWKSISWAEYGRKAQLAGLGLCALGMQPGELATILAESIPEWLFADMGVLGAGGISVGIYPTSSRDQVAYILNDSAAVYLFVEDEEQLDKYLERRGQLPGIRRVIVFDMEGLRAFRDPMVMSFDELLALGEAREAAHPTLWQERIAGSVPDRAAIFVYTSGTTGPPKGAMLSHRNILFAIERFAEAVETNDKDQTLAFLPLCHMAERTMTAFRPLGYGGVVNFAESPDTVLENLREISPTVFFAVPRIWEKLYSTVVVTLLDATKLEQWAYKQAMKVGYAVAERQLDHREIPAPLRALHWLISITVLRNVKKLTGLDKARLIGSGAAPISPDVLRWFIALGIPMIEMYGQTECSGLATAMSPHDIKLGTVGKPLQDTEVVISPEGEILIRGPHVFLGYHNKPDRTRDAIDDKGWLHSGDIGMIDNQGFVKITDRKNDIIITSGGKNITPTEIENKIKFSPYVTDAIVIGDRRNYLTCLVMIDHDNVAKYAQDRKINFTDYKSLTNLPEVRELIWAEVEKVNGTLSNVESIKKISLLDILLTAEDEEMTPTLKLRRKFVNEKYGDVINRMYRPEVAAAPTTGT
jgi:long-chain acyl-CoA synthetase